MKKRNLICKLAYMGMVFVLGAGVLAGCSAGGSSDMQNSSGNQEVNKPADIGNGELCLYTWDGMFPQEVLDDFEKETGIRIYYSSFIYDEEMLMKLEETKGGDYDLIIADDYIIEMAIAQGLVQKLDKSKLSNWNNINPMFQGQFYDKEDEYTVPYGAGVPLIVYDPDKVEIPIKGYSDLWDASLKDNIALLGNYRVIDGIVLKTLGYSFNTNDLTQIEEAGKKLMELADNVRLIDDSNSHQALISGEVSAAFLYTSQVYEALNANPNLVTVVPEEGPGFGIMAGFIPSDAPNAAAAHLFLNYILRPEVSARCFEYLGYYCTTKAAESYISEEMKDLLILPEGISDGEIIENISDEANELHERIWNEFLSSCN